MPKSDGTFSTTFHVGGSTWSNDGTYTIKASYGGNLEKTFSYHKLFPDDSKSPSQPPVKSPSQHDVNNEEHFADNPKNRIPNFPSLEISPQYYIDRYNNESNYRSWFDSQFPEKSIYEILGFSTYIPDWIKTYAKLWATGGLTDSEFISGLDFMLENQIIISNIQYTEQNSISSIPSWMRNTSGWWANNLITEQEFVNSLKYLIEEQIIEIQ